MTQKRLKILFASIPQPRNRFVRDLQTGIVDYADVTYDYEAFWKCDQHFDVVHIHEPEYLSFEVEACMDHTNPIPADLWQRLINCLEYWKANSKLVHTRHVQEPHVRTDEEFMKLYQTVFSYCDAVAHFAQYSIQQFKEFYPEFNHLKHVVIPHQNYTSLPNDISRTDARKKLGISNDAKVLLVFGMVKEREKPLIKTAYNAIPGSKKVLLAPGWKVPRRPIKWIRLREWIYKFDLWRAKKNKQFRTNLGFIQESKAQNYLNAADVLLIPRIDELNSGNITLGCTFGLVVIGRNGGDIGEILTELGNPVFDPNDEVSIVRTVQSALQLSTEGKGQNNKKIALDEWKLEKISSLYLDLYKSVF